MPDNTNAVVFPRLFNLNSTSSIWVAANSLDEAIDCYAKWMGHTREELLSEEMVCNPEEVPFEKWKDFTYAKDDGTPTTFEHQMWDVLNAGETAPFLLAVEDY